MSAEKHPQAYFVRHGGVVEVIQDVQPRVCLQASFTALFHVYQVHSATWSCNTLFRVTELKTSVWVEIRDYKEHVTSGARMADEGRACVVVKHGPQVLDVLAEKYPQGVFWWHGVMPSSA